VYPNPHPGNPLGSGVAAVTRGPTQPWLFGCLGSEPKARSRWFDALTIAWLELVVKEWWSACQVAQCQGLLAVFSWWCLSSLLVEVSRLSSPLTGRVEILSTFKEEYG